MFRCRCAVGDGRTERFPQWGDHYFKRFVPDNARDSPSEVEFRKKQKEKAERSIYELMEKRDFAHPMLMAFEKARGKEEMRQIWERYSK